MSLPIWRWISSDLAIRGVTAAEIQPCLQQTQLFILGVAFLPRIQVEHEGIGGVGVGLSRRRGRLLPNNQGRTAGKKA
jgi:hypothetical protein